MLMKGWKTFKEMEPTLTENNTFQNFDSFYFQMQMLLIRNLNKIN